IQVAEHAWVNGKRLPVVFYPADAWGERIQTAFVERWQSLGGDITSSQSYDSNQYDFGEPIKSTLRIDQSQQRRKRLQSLLGTQLEFEPRRREDVDFIFLVAKAAKARQIRPQIQFHHANDLPVYTTSSAWPGYVNINRDRDIEGILFPDIPWLLADEGSESLSLSAYNNIMGITQSGAYRLVAMGIDSYQLLAHLARLQNSPDEALDGKTGQLYMDRLNNIHRQLVWAEMKNSIPRVTGYAPRINSGFFDSQQAEPVETNLEPSPMENNPGSTQGI
ncbi:MAG: penicillin-binding protein activator, partial [Gammaproteobacteria bacterium]